MDAMRFSKWCCICCSGASGSYGKIKREDSWAERYIYKYDAFDIFENIDPETCFLQLNKRRSGRSDIFYEANVESNQSESEVIERLVTISEDVVKENVVRTNSWDERYILERISEDEMHGPRFKLNKRRSGKHDVTEHVKENVIFDLDNTYRDTLLQNHVVRTNSFNKQNSVHVYDTYGSCDSKIDEIRTSANKTELFKLLRGPRSTIFKRRATTSEIKITSDWSTLVEDQAMEQMENALKSVHVEDGGIAGNELVRMGQAQIFETETCDSHEDRHKLNMVSSIRKRISRSFSMGYMA